MSNLIPGNPLLGRYYVRSMANCDMQAVELVERTSAENFWTIHDFRRIVKSRGVQGRIITDFGKIVAFFVYEMNENGIQILNFAILPEYRRKGLGSAMLGVLKNRLHANQRTLSVNVRETNLFAQYFLRANGFKATGVERDYFVDYTIYDDKKIEDAFTFVYHFCETDN